MKKKNLLKSVFLLCALVVGSNAWGQNYVKVTSTTQLVAGKDYLLVNVAGEKSLGTWTAGSSNKDYYALTDVTANSDKSQITNAQSAHVLQLGGATDAWTLYDKTDSKYLSCNADANGVQQSATATTNAQKWTISVTTAGVATITNNSQTARMLQYNASNTRWACYKSSSNQANGVLYVKATETTDPEITFNNGNVRVGRNLDLSTLFTSNSTGAVTYSITAGGSYASLSGSILTGVAEGSVTVKAEQAAVGDYNAGEATATITVDPALALSSIAITTAPTKTTYTEGETFDPTGMVVTATYVDSSTEDVTALCTYSPTTALTTSNTEITVSYTENAVEKTATQAITVNPLRYTVTFNDGGSVTQESYGAAVTLPSRSAIGSYTFYGWNTSNVPSETTTAPTIIPAGSYTPTADITLYPVYTRTVGGSAQEYTPSVSIVNYAAANSWANEGQYSVVTLDANVKATGSTNGNNSKYYTNGNNWRFYSTTTPAGKVTISTTSGTLNTVTLTFSGGFTYGGNAITSGTAVNVSGTSAVFTCTSNVKITAIEVKYTITSSPTTYYTSGYSKSISAWTTEPVGGWYLIAAPVGTTAAAGIGNLTSNTYDLYRFNQASELEWENYKQEGDHQYFALEPGKGYLYANNTNVTLTFFDQSATNTTKDVTLTFSEDNPKTNMRGWNLIGNPFATTATIKDSEGEDKPFYRMNDDHTDLITSTTTGDVNALEGIFVHTDSGEDVTFTKASKGAANNNDNNLVIDLSAEKGNVIDRAIVRFDKGEALPKFQLRDNSTKLCIAQDGKEYAIVNAKAQGEMPVNFRANESGQYTLTVNAEDVEMNYLHLIDNMTGANIDLLQTPSYSFEASTSDYESRFRLVFASNNASTSLTDDETFAFFSNGSLIINNEGQAMLQIVDVNGRIISNETVNGSVSKAIDLTPGVYVMRLINGDNVRTQKIVVR